MKQFRHQLTLFSEARAYARLYLRHMTAKRLANLVRCALDLLMCRSRTDGRPFMAKFETSNVCNLRCALCTHGTAPKDKPRQPRRIMDLDTFRAVMEQTAEHLFFVVLYHKGEPFLNKALLDLCAEASRRNVGSVVSTNFSHDFSDADIDRMVDSGLTYLTVSLDGATQEVYEKYRVGGNLDKALDNVRRLVAAKKRLGSKTPFIAWQYIEFDHNKHEVDQAAAMAKDVGVDYFVLKRNVGTCTVEDYKIGDYNPDAAKPPRRCPWLWSTVLFLSDGEVVPCCFYNWEKTRCMGTVAERPFAEIWNSPEYRLNRELVCGKASKEEAAGAFCLDCPLKK